VNQCSFVCLLDFGYKGVKIAGVDAWIKQEQHLKRSGVCSAVPWASWPVGHGCAVAWSSWSRAAWGQARVSQGRVLGRGLGLRREAAISLSGAGRK